VLALALTLTLTLVLTLTLTLTLPLPLTTNPNHYPSLAKVIDWSQCGGVLKPLTRRMPLSPFCPPEARGPGEYDGRLVDV